MSQTMEIIQGQYGKRLSVCLLTKDVGWQYQEMFDCAQVGAAERTWPQIKVTLLS